MTDCTEAQLTIPGFDRRPFEVNFQGGDVTSDAGGCLLLRQAERSLCLLRRVTRHLPDPRNQDYIHHEALELLRQRVFGIALGYEDLNDHDTLRNDLGLKFSVGKHKDLASSTTLHRFEHWSNRSLAVKIHEEIVNTFIASFKSPPTQLILDFDATDDRVHGNQEGRFFHGYYGDYCFLPLYVFCGEQLLVSYLRPSKQDAAKHAWAILALLVKRLRQVWPEVQIIFRGDSGFCRHKMLRWCERHGVDYMVGLAQNKRLNALTEPLQTQAEKAFEATGEKQRLFQALDYQANSWHCSRKVIAKAEHTKKGRNPRYVVTSLPGEGQELYEAVYCARGDMENRIKEQQLYLFADRTSCQKWWPNQFRLLLSSLAYVLMEYIRRVGLTGTELARAQCQTIRLKLFKIGAIILYNTRRIRFLLSSGYPLQNLLFNTLARLGNTT
jgi:hypothetical protein